MSQRQAIVITVILIAISSIGFWSNYPGTGVQVEGQYTSIWSADFETGDNSQFTTAAGGSNVKGGNILDECNNGVVGVSTTIVHSGSYAGYYYGGLSGDKCHESPNLWFKSTYRDFYWEGWFYVPSSEPVCGDTCWVSFATFGNNVQNYVILAIDSVANRQVYLWSVGLERAFRQNMGTTIKWPYDRWFKLSMIAHNMGSTNADFTMYEDDVPIVHGTGNLMPGPMYAFHAGVYIGGGQPSWAVYNDDLAIEDISLAGTATTISTVTSTVTRTITSLSTLRTTKTTTITTTLGSTTRTTTSTAISLGLGSMLVMLVVFTIWSAKRIRRQTFKHS